MAMAANWWPPATWPTETATVKHSKPVPTASMVSFCAVVDMWTLFWARLWQRLSDARESAKLSHVERSARAARLHGKAEF